MKTSLTLGRTIAGVTILAAAVLIAALFWKPPSGSSDVASWVQAFGSVAAILLAVYLQYAGARDRKNDQLLARIQATNSAITLAGLACNLALALKKQHTQPAHDALLRARKEHDDFVMQRVTAQRQGNAPFVWKPDLSSFPPPVIPTEMLRELVVNGASPHGRAVGAGLQVEQAYVSLRDSMARRDLLARRLATHEVPKGLHAHYLLGLPLPDGGVNREYPDLVGVIHEHAEDMVFFASQLCDDLTEHGKILRTKLHLRFPEVAPKIVTIDFTVPRSSGAIPPAARYEDWLRGFAFPHEPEAPHRKE